MPDVMIPANGTETFVVTVSVVDSQNAVDNSDYTVSLVAATVEDDDRDDVTATGLASIVSARAISVEDAGQIVTLYYDDANSDNEFNKVALAGDMVVLGSLDVRADNEEVDVEEVTFEISGVAAGTLLKNTVSTATLLLDGVEVGTNSNSDISNTEIKFEDLTALIIPETTSELAIRLNTANIGDDFVGQAQTGLSISGATMTEARGVDSGEDANVALFGTDAVTTLDIVPAVVTPTVASTFGTDDKTAELRLVVDAGDNTSVDDPATTTVDEGGNAVQAELVSLTFEVSSFSGVAGDLTVFNSNGTNVGTVAVDGILPEVTVTLSPTDSIGNEDETYRIETSAEGIYRLTTDGVVYTVDGGATSITTSLQNTLSLGEYGDSN